MPKNAASMKFHLNHRRGIEQRIFAIRGQKVMLDKDLANLYGISTSSLNKAVSRNLTRFPADFMFSLSTTEFQNLMFHFGTSKRGGTRKLPRVFTEHGILMLSSVLKIQRAVQVNIEIMRTFVKLRALLVSHKELAYQLNKLEDRVGRHDEQILVIFETIRKLTVV